VGSRNPRKIGMGVPNILRFVERGARPSDKSLYVIAKGTAHGPCSLHEDLPVGA